MELDNRVALQFTPLTRGLCILSESGENFSARTRVHFFFFFFCVPVQGRRLLLGTALDPGQLAASVDW